MATRKLEVIITGDAKSLEKALGKAGDNGKSFAKTMGKAGVAGAILGLGAAVKIGVGEFMEAEKVTAQTNAVLKSTGGAANVTAKEITGLSEALMKKSGVDDEAIQTGQNMLLTFTKIRNETGKGNKIFDQATKATLDLSVAMGKDMQSSALLLGKALNDPVKGMASLGRAGVQFTDDQKDMIKGLVEGATAARALSTVIDEKLTPAQYKSALEMEKAGMNIEDIAKKLNVKFTPAQMTAAHELQKGGKAMEAQKIILKELETQFGGSAEAAGKTFSGQINIAKQTLMNLAGEGVGKLMPHLVALGTWFGETVVPKIKAVIQALTGSDGLKGAFGGVKSFVTDTFLPAVRGIFDVFSDVLAAVKRVLDSKKAELKVIFDGIATAAKVIGTVFTEVVVPALKLVFVKGGPFDIVFGLAIGIVAGLVKVISGIVGGFKTAVNAVRDFWDGDGGKVFKTVFGAMADAVRPVKAAIEAIVDAVKWLIDNIKKIPSVPSFGPSHTADPKWRGKDGDPRDPRVGTGFNLMGANPVMAPFAAGAADFGLQVTSGLRPGAITRNGTPSDHGKGLALDVAGAASGMAAFFKSLLGNRMVRQAFYDPLGSIFGGAWSSYREGGHSDHVHVATYDRGGVLKPGLTLAYNGTGRPEQVVGPGGGGDIVIQVSGETIARIVNAELIRAGRRGAGVVTA